MPKTRVRLVRLLIPFLLIVGVRVAVAQKAAGEGGAPRVVVVMLDGVPFSVVDSLWRAGHFEAFSRPSRVVSPFPSLTGVAFPAMWGEAPPPGYEDRYFDPAANRMRGGLLSHLLAPGEHAGFRAHVDVETGGVLATLGYVFPEALAAREVRELREALGSRSTSDSTLVAYMVATDAVAHRAGRAELVDVLLELESVLETARARYGRDLRIVLFSDHGNDFVASRRVALEDSLRTAGYELADRIEDADDIVVPRFGLVGSSSVYTWPGAEAEVARVLVRVPGVDLVAHADGPRRVRVRSRGAEALIDVRGAGARYRYEPVRGDPLGLAVAARRFQESGLADSAGFAPDSAWFRATRETPYIDALRRIDRGMRAVVRHPASVVVSYEPGYYLGNPAADLLVDVAGTHGSLRTASSLAFFMTTGAPAPRTLRGDGLHRYLPVEETAATPGAGDGS